MKNILHFSEIGLTIDAKYILGRDNYSCVYCLKELTLNELYVSKINEKGEWLGDNTVVSCNKKDCILERSNLTAFQLCNFPQSSLPGRLIVVASCMFSEKTTTTRSLLNKYGVIYDRLIWTKPDVDARGKGITTHNKEEISAKIISSQRPDQSLGELSNYDIIAFDEVQFYSERILYVVHQLLKMAKLVIVNGLKLDYKRNIFGVIHYLMAEADDVISPKAVCNRCNRIDIATRTKKKNENGPSIDVGGEDKYFASCSDCEKGDLYEKKMVI